MDFAFWYTLGILIIMSIALVKEWMEVEIIIFSALILLLAGQVITVKEAFAGFSNEGMLTIGLLFVIAGALHNSGAIQQLNRRIFGDRPLGLIRVLLKLLFPVAGISAFMNNTPVVAILIPVVRNWTDKVNIAPSKLFIPLSYAAILGGMCTLIGTSTNLIIHGLMIDFGMPGMSLFEISKVGVPVALIGILYIVFVSRWLLPDRKEAFSGREDVREFVIELKVAEEYQNIGKTIEEAGLRHLTGLFLFQIERQGKIIAPAAPTEEILLNDRLFFTGLPKTILELQKTPGLQLLKDSTFDLKQYDASQIHPFEAVVSASSPLIGKNVRESNFRSTYNAVIIAIHRNGSRINRKIGDIVIHPGDTLLLLADKQFYKNWYNSKEFYLVSQTETVPSRPFWQRYLSIAVLVAMVVSVVTNLLPIMTAAGLAVMLMIVTRTISRSEVIRSVDFRVLVIIAAAFGIAEALDNSGLAGFIAHGIVAYTESFGVIGVLSGIFIVTSLYTNIMTNNATAALVFPIAFAAAQELQMDPRPFLITLAIAASASFVTPISYQTNLMVYGPGGYKFIDFIRIGLPLQIIVTVVSIGLIYGIYF